MRKVKYNNSFRLQLNYHLTVGKVYDVVQLGKIYFKIIGDDGYDLVFGRSNRLFTDVTTEHRSELIDEILK